jgi:cytoskeletal protein CcmA (bactofilin family)
MGIFNRTKEDQPPADPVPAATLATPAAREADLGTPVFRPTSKEAAAMTVAPRPTAVPTPPNVGPRPGDRRTLVVGRGITLQGTVADAERLVVEGTVDSKMIHAAELFVAQAGVFKGEVEVEIAEIAGTFDGSITARGSLTIRATGAVSGVTRCRKLSVEEGGQLSGQMAMLTDAASAEPVRPPAPSVRAQV